MIDVVHDATNVIDEDRISNLPDDIIHHILSFLDIKHAVQTSQLSRRWKHVWTSMPHLRFNSRMFHNMHRFAKFTYHVLSHRNNESDVSEIELTFTGLTTKPFVKNVVNYAYLHNVRKLTMICKGRTSHLVPHHLFSSHTLKHFTLQDQSCGYQEHSLPTFAWDFPALETLSLGHMCFGGFEIKSINLFSKCVNLKDLTLHRVSMHFLDTFNVCCLQLANLTITDVISFPKVFNVVAPKLKNLTASVRALRDPETSFDCLQLTEGSDSLDKVNLFLSPLGSNRIDRIGLPVLLNLFQKLRSANFLILNSKIIETLGSNMNQLSHEPCPFNNLKCVKIEDRISKIATQVRKYLLNNSRDATFIMDLPQKRPLEPLYEEAKSKVAKLEEKIQMQDEVITEQKLVHEKLLSHIIKCKIAELQVQVEAGNPDYEIVRSMSNEIESVMDLIPKSLRLNMEAQFFSQYEALKSLFLTQIDASEWEKIEAELRSIRHFERTHSTNIDTQSNAPADVLMSELNLDIFEQILVRMDARDLIRCKGVCKSWKSLISEDRFIKTQLDRSITTHRNNNGTGHRRITISLLPDGFTSWEGAAFCNLLGSSNGLVCIYASRSQILVANPCTREVKLVTQIRDFGTRYGSICYGFGYDESIDDYKVVVGVRKGVDRTCFQVLSLKSNVWKVVGEVENTYVSGVGILCNGALHWVMNQASPIIVSFDLTQELVKEIPQPDDVLYQSTRNGGSDMSLGIIEGCLCIYPNAPIPRKIWMMKKYNVKESWGIVEESRECELNREILRFFRQLKNGIPFESSEDCNILFFRTREFISAPIFVHSLVSPPVRQRSYKEKAIYVGLSRLHPSEV